MSKPLVTVFRSLLLPRSRLLLENLAFRHQLAVLKRSSTVVECCREAPPVQARPFPAARRGRQRRRGVGVPVEVRVFSSAAGRHRAPVPRMGYLDLERPGGTTDRKCHGGLIIRIHREP